MRLYCLYLIYVLWNIIDACSFELNGSYRDRTLLVIKVQLDVKEVNKYCEFVLNPRNQETNVFLRKLLLTLGEIKITINCFINLIKCF